MTADVLVVGGGVAGAAVAAYLARAGRHVILLERKSGPHDKVCGEFVSGEAADYLRDLDIDLEGLGAVRISTVRIYARQRLVSAKLRFPAFSISRRVLDEAILRTAASCGAQLQRGHAVKSLHPFGCRWIVGLDGAGELGGCAAFLATGKHDLRGWKRPSGSQNDLIAFKLYWRLSAEQVAALTSCVDLFIFRGGYAGLSLVENGIGNLCLVIRKSYFGGLGNVWDALLSSLRAEFLPLAEKLAGAEPCYARPLAIASIPYGYVRKRSIGPWCVGDQAAVIPSFSGAGIAIALHSARLAAEYYLAGKTNSEFQTCLARDVTGQVQRATLMSRVLVQRWGQIVMMGATRLVPRLISDIADLTRIPNHRL